MPKGVGAPQYVSRHSKVDDRLDVWQMIDILRKDKIFVFHPRSATQVGEVKISITQLIDPISLGNDKILKGD